jgi:hypothetical protein
MIRSLSLGLTTVLQAPERRDATHGLPSGLHTSGRTTVCFELIQSLLRVDTESASGRTTLREASVACASATEPWHVRHGIGFPED